MNKKIFEIQRFATDVTLTAGDDTFSNKTADIAVYALAGNDSIHNTADNVTVNAAEGNDTITNTVYNSVVLNGDEGDDVIISTDQGDYPGEILMDGGAGNDILKSEREIRLSYDSGASYSPEEVYGTLSGGIGDDTIQVNALDNFLDGGEGDDKLYSSGSNNKLNGGAGNDVLSADTYDYTAVIDEARSYSQ